MSTHRNRRGFIALGVLAALAAVAIVRPAVGVAAPINEGGGTTVDYPRDPAMVVLRYSERLGGIANPDSPSVTIYGDGRAVVHWPEYTKRRGDYELRLTSSEMDGLLRSLVDKGMLGFDPAAVRQAKRDANARARAAEPEIFVVSDDSSSTIEMTVDRAVTAAPGGAGVTRVNKTITWRGARTDARRHPDIAAIQNLAQLEQELRGLLQRPDLTKTK